MINIIIIIFWFASAIIAIPETIILCCGELPLWKLMLVSLVIAVEAPFLIITQAAEMILDCLLEEGWNDDDDKFGY